MEPCDTLLLHIFSAITPRLLFIPGEEEELSMGKSRMLEKPTPSRTSRQSAYGLTLSGVLFSVYAAPIDSTTVHGARDTGQRHSRLSIPKTDCLRSFDDVRYITTTPARFRCAQWGVTTALAGCVALSFAADQPLRQYIIENRTAPSRRVLQPFYYNDLGAVVAPLAIGMYAGGVAFSLPWLHETGRMAITALLLSATTSSLLKMPAAATVHT
jgi:hypothetical protein